MTPKRLRLIAHIIRKGVPGDSASTLAIADELDGHAVELEAFLAANPPKLIRLKEPKPATVFNDVSKTFPEASKGMR